MESFSITSSSSAVAVVAVLPEPSWPIIQNEECQPLPASTRNLLS